MLALLMASGRFSQYAGAMILFGSPLFFSQALSKRNAGEMDGTRWARRLLASAVIAVLLGALVSFWAGAADMTGSVSAALQASGLAMVLTDSQFGHAIAARLALTVLYGLVLLRPVTSRAAWMMTSVLGGIIVCGFAWTGHGVADAGIVGVAHLVSDILHLLAAAVWLGALAVLTVLVARAKDPSGEALTTIHQALIRFSGVGPAVVAVLVLSGLANSWFLVGPAHLGGLVSTPYGLLLLAKIALFLVMLSLAAANRWRHTPRLSAVRANPEGAPAIGAALKRTLLLETILATGVLAILAVLGTLAPPVAQ